MRYMRSIGVRELRQNATAYLNEVAAGETIAITHHGHPVAHLIPATTDAWTALIASNEVTPARAHPCDILSQPPRTYRPAGPTLCDMRRDER
jgi:prevent-host-death family protein